MRRLLLVLALAQPTIAGVRFADTAREGWPTLPSGPSLPFVTRSGTSR